MRAAPAAWSLLLATLQLLCAGCVAGFLFWASDRGLDFEDHSLQQLSSRCCWRGGNLNLTETTRRSLGPSVKAESETTTSAACSPAATTL